MLHLDQATSDRQNDRTHNSEIQLVGGNEPLAPASQSTPVAEVPPRKLMGVVEAQGYVDEVPKPLPLQPPVASQTVTPPESNKSTYQPIPVAEQSGSLLLNVPEMVPDDANSDVSTDVQPQLDSVVTPLPPAPHWPKPKQLVAQLEKLKDIPACGSWARSVLQQIDRLQQTGALSSPDVASIIGELQRLVREAGQTIPSLSDGGTRTQLSRAQYSLARRLDIWQHVHLLETQHQTASRFSAADPRVVVQMLHAIDIQLRQLDHADSWREYLLIDKGTQVFVNPNSTDEQRQDLAHTILDNLTSPVLTLKQQEYFQQPLFVQFVTQLRHWASPPMDYPSLLTKLEEYEDAGNDENAYSVSQGCRSLLWAHDAGAQKLGKKIDTHYRNANFRVAASGELLNRFLPSEQEYIEKVRDNYGGATVQGTSKTKNRLMLKLIPDRWRVRMSLESHGEVLSDTGASSGPVTFFDRSRAKYLAKKLILFDRSGLKVRSAEANADSQTFTKNLRTDYDGTIIGGLVRSIAKSERDERASQTKREVEQDIATKAKTRFDDEVHTRLAKAEREFQSKVVDPLRRMQLNPETIGMETTEDRVIIRCRLAGYSQLGARTSRPQALTDSMLSAQIHQSAVNNFVQKMDLDGKTFELHDLFRQVSSLFEFSKGKIPEDLPTNVKIRFADEDAVRFDFDDGRVRITVKIAELIIDGRPRWRELVVRTYYAPTTNGLQAYLARGRDSFIELSGSRLRLRDQIALRTIFSKVFSANQSWSIVPDKVVNSTRLQDLQIGQLSINDGWIGVALAPRPEPRTEAERKRLFQRILRR